MTSSIKKLVVKKSTVSGSGIFADEDIKKGEVVMIWSIDCNIISESEYNEEQSNGNQNMIKTGARFVDGYFLYTDENPRVEDNMNHSFEPNILYHCGVCFALRDISCGEELFVNYKYILSRGDYAGFVDEKTGVYVDGMDSLDCLKETTTQLLNLLNGIS